MRSGEYTNLSYGKVSISVQLNNDNFWEIVEQIEAINKGLAEKPCGDF